MIQINKIKEPFIYYCQKVIPLAFDESLSYYEVLCHLTAKIKEVIEEQNIEGQAIQELQEKYLLLVDYVDNYFDNLDIQEEINNKLDEMAESGELTDIIAQYLQLAGVLAYNTLNDLENAENIANGSICMILGKDTYNDGKTTYYKIREILNTDIIDGDNIIAITNDNTLVGEKIDNYFNNEILPLTKPQDLYIASFFDNNQNINNYLYASSNGKSFTKLSNVPWNNVRDVDIIYYNNLFYAITTETSEDLSIGDLYISNDLINWNRKALYLDLGQTNTSYRNYPCKWFIDTNGKIYLTGAYQVGTTTDSITGITDRDFRIYTVEITNMDFNNFTFGTPNILSNIDYNVIDPFIIKKDNTYYMFIKKNSNEGTYLVGTIQTLTSNDLITWTRQATTISSLGSYRYEGPSVCEINNQYIMYLDNYNGDNGSYMQFITSNDLINWSDPCILQCEGYTTRHGAVRKLESGIAEKVILSYANKYKNNYLEDLRKCIILPSINANKTNKYIKIANIKCNENYRSLRVNFKLKDIQNNAIDSEYYLSIKKENGAPTIEFREEFNKITSVDKLVLQVIDNNNYELYYATLSYTSCTPCIVFDNLMCSAYTITINENMTTINSLPSGTSYKAIGTTNYNRTIISDIFRIEKINTLGSDTSITATFNNKQNYQSFSCIIYGRSNCILFQCQVNGSGILSDIHAYDMTGQGKTYTTSSTTNTVTISGLNNYNEYTLLINDTTRGDITFSK